MQTKDVIQTADQKLDRFLRELSELQQDFEQKVARLRSITIQAADEQRELRHAAENAKLVVYTEAEAADVLKIGESTLRHMRTADPSFPCFRPGSAVRYTNFHLVEITELLDNREQKRAKKKRTQLRVAGGR